MRSWRDGLRFPSHLRWPGQQRARPLAFGHDRSFISTIQISAVLAFFLPGVCVVLHPVYERDLAGLIDCADNSNVDPVPFH